jgi:hypothetical protein
MGQYLIDNTSRYINSQLRQKFTNVPLLQAKVIIKNIQGLTVLDPSGL